MNTKPPNILIVMTDHQRADTTLAGHACVTPNLDRFSQEATRFSNAYCPSPHCCPSRATFFSGLYPSGHGVWNNLHNGMALSTGLKPGVRLWSEDLREAGYDLRFCGKWHVSAEETPKDRGWQEHFVSSAQGLPNQAPWDAYRKLAREEAPQNRGEGQILRPGYGTYTLYGTRPETGGPHDEQVTASALEALHELAGQTGPWCLYVGWIGPHDPYFAPQRCLDRYRLEDIRLPDNFADRLEDKPRIYQRMRRQIFDQLSEREAREGIRHYLAYCTYLDELFGRILDGLEKTGQADDTVVVYCSDHGDYCGEHGLFAKGIPCFQGAYHVPAIVRWRNGPVERGRQADALISLADFGPTFLELAGLPRDRHFSGASLLPLLRGEEPAGWRQEIFTQCNGVELYFTQRSVRTAEYKYVFNGFDQDELYDLRNDPGETVNLANDPQFQPVIQDLCRRLWRFAEAEGDQMINSYITVGLAPFGPAQAFTQSP